MKKIYDFKYYNFLLTNIFIIIFFTPFLSRNFSNLLILVLLSLWFITAFLSVYPKSIKLSIIFGLIFSWILMTIIYRILGLSTTSWGNVFIQPIIFFPILIYYLYVNFMKKKYLDFLLKNIFLIGLINIISNLYLNIIYPNASVLLNYTDRYKNTNVGGTEFTLFALLYFLIVIYKLFKKFSFKLLIVALICSLYIIISGRFITIAFLIIGIVIMFIQNRLQGKNLKQKLLFTISSILVAGLIYFLGDYVLQLVLSNISYDNRLYFRISEIRNILYSVSSINSNISIRISLNITSSRTFLSSFENLIIGVGEHDYIDINTALNFGVGKHSEIFDLLAQYGMIGFIILFSLVRVFYIRHIKKFIKTNTKEKLIKQIFIIFILYSLFNNSLFTLNTVIIFLYMPLILIKENLGYKK